MPPDEQLQLLAACLARARGEDFYPVLAEHLGATLGAREALLCEAAPARRARTLAVWRPGGSTQNFEYDLAGTPCARVYSGERLSIEIDPVEFPGAPQRWGGYFGMPLAAKDGVVLGHLCAWFDAPVTLTDTQHSVCEVLANRAAAELRLMHVKRERALLRAQRSQLRAEIAHTHDLQDIVGTGAAHRLVLDEVRRLSGNSGAVLVTGEPGTGKSLVARAIHASGARAAKPFTCFDCTQLQIESGIDSLPQTFGVSIGGTLLLDEVGALAPVMQARLLEVLQSFGAERRTAGTPDVRIIATSNRDLLAAARNGAFRGDLLRALGPFAIELPPLRARVEDIPALLQHLVQKQSRRLGRRVDGVDPDSVAALMRYSWPGNVRELVGLVERAVMTQPGPILKISAEFMVGSPAERAALIAAAAADPATSGRTTFSGMIDLDETLNTGLHDVQREHILRVLNATHWVIEGNSGAALRLGLKPATLRHRMKKLGISRIRNPAAP
ncbi:MAG TPA: sigma 54-interacting transcriptional regulator [Steroidobacteraceae bacterium]|nr:sigma 54-interacting transcriptional regulator [Steroidobacteraceae bacterium]